MKLAITLLNANPDHRHRNTSSAFSLLMVLSKPAYTYSEKALMSSEQGTQRRMDTTAMSAAMV